MERMLSLGGEAMRPVLVSQLLEDLGRLAGALQSDAIERAGRAAHELKGLAATIGAVGLADQAQRFDALLPEATPAVRQAMALGLRRQIEVLCAALSRPERNISAA